jgi:hypothetical protein
MPEFKFTIKSDDKTLLPRVKKISQCTACGIDEIKQKIATKCVLSIEAFAITYYDTESKDFIDLDDDDDVEGPVEFPALVELKIVRAAAPAEAASSQDQVCPSCPRSVLSRRGSYLT